MAGFYGQYLDTIGIEFEGVGLEKNRMTDYFMELYPDLLGDRKLQFVHDASTEFFGEYLRGNSALMVFSTHTKAAKKIRQLNTGNRVTMGYELVTQPMTMAEMESVVHRTISALNNMGEFTTERTATHFHIGFANSLKLLKNLLRVCLMLDPVLYRLGGMGGTFRGRSNLSAYARPLLHSVCTPISMRKPPSQNIAQLMQNLQQSAPSWTAPTPSVPEISKKDGMISGNFAQIINPISALEATSIEQFWACFGVDYPRGGEIKYHPVRYTGCNFFSIPAHGTFEFRHFNQSLNSILIVAIAKLLRGIVEMSTKLNSREILQFETIDTLEQISTGDALDVISTIISMCREKEVENLPTENEMSLIQDTLIASSVESIPEMPVLTHIPDFSVPSYTVALGNLQEHSLAFMPNHVDIHTIKLQSLFPKGDFNV